MEHPKEYAIYRAVIQQIMRDEEQLPSLPAITWQVRSALADNNTTSAKLARLIRRDPSLSALLMKCASSPLYRRQQSPTTLEGVISLLGFAAVDNLVMMHSVKSLFVMRSLMLKKLFRQTWQQLLLKEGISGFLANKLGYQPPDQAMIAALLSEIGSLVVLSAFKDRKEVPSEEVYHQLCREYGKSLGCIVLAKWKVEPLYIEVVRSCGRWDLTVPGGIQLIDLVNLALYCATQLLKPNNNLPEIEALAAYKKLPAPFNSVDIDHRQLHLVSKHIKEITQLSYSLK